MRVTTDLADLDLHTLIRQANQHFAAPEPRLHFVSKHLCGPATDFSLRAVINSSSQQLSSVAIATCCHYLCTPESLVGRALLKLSDDDVRNIAQCSQWASLVPKPQSCLQACISGKATLAELSKDEKAQFGRAVRLS
jgi:hypothetical protein